MSYDMSKLICPECGSDMVLRSSRFGKFFGCIKYPDCSGTHSADVDGNPLGVPGDSVTKDARKRLHRQFDKLWKLDQMSRFDAYQWLAKVMEMSPEEAHIGRFNIDQCHFVMEKLCELLFEMFLDFSEDDQKCKLK